MLLTLSQRRPTARLIRSTLFPVSAALRYDVCVTPFARSTRRIDRPMTSSLEKLCAAKGVRMTEQRRVVLRVLSESTDHPNADVVFRRAARIDPHISMATVYRTVSMLEEAEILDKHDFGGGKARYEKHPESHHDHLIDVRTGKVIEFSNAAIEELQQQVAQELGFRLVGHRLELYAVPLAESRKRQAKQLKT